ncbi:helix-turn-helix domain-containing protein [Tenacibaculum maritimum]|uniref:helix-turn-helix domain-containing protein n=1 Tax=Tenacibaculum maritimum TaxID=107401 RepID=UPI000A01A5FD
MQLADKVGITYIQIGRYETGKSNASSDVLKKIAIAVNTTTDFLMNGGNAEQLNDKELLNPAPCRKVSFLHKSVLHLAGRFHSSF